MSDTSAMIDTFVAFLLTYCILLPLILRSLIKNQYRNMYNYFNSISILIIQTLFFLKDNTSLINFVPNNFFYITNVILAVIFIIGIIGNNIKTNKEKNKE